MKLVSSYLGISEMLNKSIKRRKSINIVEPRVASLSNDDRVPRLPLQTSLDVL